MRRKQTFLVIERITRDGSPCSRVAFAHLIPSRFFLELIPPTKIFERSSREKRGGSVLLCFGRNDRNFPVKSLRDETALPSTGVAAFSPLYQLLPGLYKEDTVPSRTVYT